MNKLFRILLALCIVCSLAGLIKADIMPDNSHSLNRCIKIDNLNDFPDIVLVSYITGPSFEGHESEIINASHCLSKGYKFNEFSLFAVNSEYLKKKGVDNINFPSDSNAVGLVLDEDPDGGYVYNSNPLYKEDITYFLAKDNDGKMILYKSKKVSKYKNGLPDKVENFEKPANAPPNDLPAKKSFFASIACFFKSLFGRGC